MELRAGLNLFDLAPRELTNSAVWAWVLDGINQKDQIDPRTPLVQRFFGGMSLPLPQGPVKITTEMALPSGGRLDIVLEWGDQQSKTLLFIENKVLPAVGLPQQVAGYLNELNGLYKRVLPVVFSHDDRAPNQLMASDLFPPENRPVAFVLKDMVSFFEGIDLSLGTILYEFYKHLSGKLQKQKQVEQALRRGGADISYWLPEIQRLGVEDLFAEYLVGAERSGCAGVDYNLGRSVAIRYADRPGLKGSPVFSLHPTKCSQDHGLWIGYNHVNWEKAFGRPFPVASLPPQFEDRPDAKQPYWHFGFFSDIKSVRALFEV